MSTKGCVGLVLFCLDLELFAKIIKDLVSTHTLFNSRSKQNKKIPHTLSYTLLSRNRVQISAKNIKLYDSWRSSKFSIFDIKSLVSWK